MRKFLGVIACVLVALSIPSATKAATAQFCYNSVDCKYWLGNVDYLSANDTYGVVLKYEARETKDGPVSYSWEVISVEHRVHPMDEFKLQ